MSRFHQVIVSLLLSGLPFFAQAEAEFYGGLDLQYSLIEVNSESVNPILGRVNGGIWVREGIGIEGLLGTTLSNDTGEGLELDVPILAAISIRLQSPEDLGTKAYFLLGYSYFELDGHLSNSSFPGSEDFTGASVSLGFLRPLGELKKFSGYLEFNTQLANDDLDFGGIALGLRYGY